jgi:hypothetical protein
MRTVAVVRTLLCWDITQRIVVIFTNVPGLPIGPNFKGQDGTFSIIMFMQVALLIHVHILIMFFVFFKVKYRNKRINNKGFLRELDSCFPTAHVSNSTYLLVVLCA